MQDVKIVGISGSLRKGSYNTALLRAAQELLPQGATLEILDISQLPLYNEDEENNFPETVRVFKAKPEAADAVLLATPEYNHSFSGVLKNALDIASRPREQNSLMGKPVAIVGASIGTMGTARAQAQLRAQFTAFNIRDVKQPEVLLGRAQESFDEESHLADEAARTLLRQLLEALVSLARTGQ